MRRVVGTASLVVVGWSCNSTAPPGRHVAALETPATIAAADAAPATASDSSLHEADADRAVRGLLARVGFDTNEGRAAGLEEQALRHAQYVEGWSDGWLLAGQPAAAAGSAIEQALCSRELSDVQRLVLVQLLLRMPAAATTAGIDCVVVGRADDIVLWTALDAWRASGLSATPGITGLRSTSSDRRTLRRLERFGVEPRERVEALRDSLPSDWSVAEEATR